MADQKEQKRTIQMDPTQWKRKQKGVEGGGRGASHQLCFPCVPALGTTHALVGTSLAQHCQQCLLEAKPSLAPPSTKRGLCCQSRSSHGKRGSASALQPPCHHCATPAWQPLPTVTQGVKGKHLWGGTQSQQRCPNTSGAQHSGMEAAGSCGEQRWLCHAEPVGTGWVHTSAAHPTCSVGSRAQSQLRSDPPWQPAAGRDTAEQSSGQARAVQASSCPQPSLPKVKGG